MQPELPNHLDVETPPWDKEDDVYLIIVGGINLVDGQNWGVGWAHHSNRYGGTALIAANSGHLNVSVIAHELGHCFGLFHKPPGTDPDPPSLEHYEARWLDKHYHFNNRTNNFTFPTPIGQPKLTVVPKGDRIHFALDVTSDIGLHQVVIMRASDILVIGWDYMDGENRHTADLQAVRSKWGRHIWVLVMDTRGNFHMKAYNVTLPEEESVAEEEVNIRTDIESTPITFNDLSSGALTPENSPLEWDGWRVGIWEKKPNSSYPPKPQGYLTFPKIDAWEHWMYSHAPSRIVYDISNNGYTKFDTIFDMPNPCGDQVSVEVSFLADGVEIYSSGELREDDRETRISVDIPNDTRKFTLEVSDLGNRTCDHFVLGNPILSGGTLQQTSPTVQTPPGIQPPVYANTDVNGDRIVNSAGLVIVAFSFDSKISDDIPTSVRVGDTFTVHISAEKVTDLAGWQFDLTFNPNVLEVIKVNEGDFLKKDGETTFFQRGTIDNIGGKVTGLSSVLISKNGGTGAGTLLSVVFSAKAEGNSQMALRNFQLGSTTGEVIPAGVRELTITVASGPTWDVNADGQVSVLDLILVAQQMGSVASANSRVDVNRDGVVSILDLILVAQHMGESTGSASPTLLAMDSIERLDPVMIQAWIEQAQVENDGSVAFREGIAYLQSLLASLIPEETALLPNYPNPFNPETWIPYQLSEPAEITLRIYSVNGELVRTLAVGHMPAGIYQNRSRAVYWDGRNDIGESVASGLYFYTLTAGDFTATRKLLIRK